MIAADVHRPRPLSRRAELAIIALAALMTIIATVALASGLVAGGGAPALAAAVFALVAIWCVVEGSTGRALVVLGLYIGMLDGFVKLRTGVQGVTILRDVLIWGIAGA